MTRSKKVITMLTALALTIALAAPALALGDIDLATAGSIAVSTTDPAFRADFEEQPAAYGQQALVDVLVYKVAGVNERGVFQLEPEFQALDGQPYWNDGILNEGLIDVQQLLEAAEAVVYPADGEPAEGVDTSDPLYEPEPAIEPTFTQQIDPLEDLISLTEHGQELGLYLLLPQKMQTVQWVYTYSPLLVAVPRIEKTTVEGETGIPAEGNWLYDVTAELKGTRVRRLTGLTIAKTLQEYNATLGATTFLFDVQATISPEGLVFSQLVPLTFSGTGTQTAEVTGIPVGAQVTVTEVYSGASYEVVNGQVGIDWLPLPDEVDGMYRVPFTNTYTDRQNPDTSLVNTWVREGEGWTWQSGEEAG